jgi:hypothetical protein
MEYWEFCDADAVVFLFGGKYSGNAGRGEENGYPPR